MSQKQAHSFQAGVASGAVPDLPKGRKRHARQGCKQPQFRMGQLKQGGPNGVYRDEVRCHG